MRIVVIGDIHGKLGNSPELDTALETADLVYLNGDITDFGGASEFDVFIEELTGYTSADIRGVPGNCDNPEILLELERKGMNLHASGEVIDGIGLMGIGGSNPTPFDTPIEFTEKDIESFLGLAYGDVESTDEIVLISHFPPKDTGADRIESGAHVGSEALRKFITEHPKLKLVVCGHIHEAMGESDLGGVPIVNHGLASEGHFVVIETTKGESGKISITHRSI